MCARLIIGPKPPKPPPPPPPKPSSWTLDSWRSTSADGSTTSYVSSNSSANSNGTPRPSSGA
eukprot:682015-Prymnesium_polylepis.2